LELTVLDEGTKTMPVRVFVSRQQTCDLLQPVAGRLGFKLKMVKSLSVLEQAKEEVLGFIGGQPLLSSACSKVSPSLIFQSIGTGA
jgi:hypothetical protein